MSDDEFVASGARGDWVRHHGCRRHAARRPAGAHDDADAAPPAGAGGAMTETAVYAAGGVVWRVVDGKLRSW
jgi:hypothetical protein